MTPITTKAVLAIAAAASLVAAPSAGLQSEPRPHQPHRAHVHYCFGRVVTMRGTRDAETLIGGPRRDVIAAGAGDDTVFSGKGRDYICGGRGQDVLVGGDQRDHINGGDGTDACDAEVTRHCEADPIVKSPSRLP